MDGIVAIRADVSRCQADLEHVWQQLDLASKLTQVEKYKQITAEPDFWQKNHLEARTISREKTSLEKLVQPWLDLRQDLNDLSVLTADSGQQEKSDFLEELQSLLDTWKEQFKLLKEQLKLSGPYDRHEVILSIFAGAGGTDAQDWVQMLLRMYTRWADRQKVAIELISQSKGEVAGLKSVSLYLRSRRFLYGHLKGEHGVHRLVRLSPFNAQNLRQTSFARVEVIPALENMEDTDLKDTDLRIDTYRSSGAGGQSVNKTNSAIRIVHLPTQLTVTVQNERSQLQNKKLALVILRSRLARLQMEKKIRTLSDLKGVNLANEWGSQIRNYVLHPYKQVKDLRSRYVTSDVDGILDGDLDELLQANSSG